MKQLLTTSGDKVMVSDKDFKKVSSYRWSTLKSKNHSLLYARRTFCNGVSRKHVFLHRFILGITDPKVKVDHRDRNGLNCTRKNLRTCTHSQNLYNSKLRVNNTSGFKGVSWNKWHKAWMVKIRSQNNYVFLGYFGSRVTGAKVYDRAARKLFGRFARTNFSRS